MTYEQHRQLALKLSREQAESDLEMLGHDPRFSAVVAWLERSREMWINSGSRQEMAGDYGRLAHGQGSVHACNILIAQLAHLLAPPSKPGGGLPG
jgi:hypothetical protein